MRVTTRRGRATRRRLLEARVQALEPQRHQRRDDRREGQRQDQDHSGGAEEHRRRGRRAQKPPRAEQVEPAEGQQKRRQEHREGVQQRRRPRARDVRPGDQDTEWHAEGERQHRHDRGEGERAQQQREGVRAAQHVQGAPPDRPLLDEQARERGDAPQEQHGARRRERDLPSPRLERRPQRPTHSRSHGWILSISSATRA
jgi:hypothetical protein